MFLWQAFPVAPGLAMALAALLGFVAGGWLSDWARRLPGALERAWAQEGAPSAGASHIPCHMPARPAWQRHVARLLAAALFAACAWRLGATPVALCGMALVSALFVLAWIDIETGLLPDAITLPLTWAGLLVNLQGALAPLPSAVLGAVAGYLFLWAVFHAFLRLTGREGMGYGDFKLMAALGAWFGIEALPWLLLVASLSGGLVGLALRWAGRAQRWQPLPFGPYLAAGGILMLLGYRYPPF